MNFKCKHTYEDGETKEWVGTVRPTKKTKHLTEAMISGRGSSFTIIAGKYINGNIICIPELNVSCPASDWKDVLWNRDRLSALMSETDAVTIAFGVKAMMEEKVKNREAE